MRGSDSGVWLGADVGTQGCRVVAVGETGQLLASASRPLRSSRPEPGRREQDPRSWCQAFAAATGEVLQALSTRRVGAVSIGAVAICGTSGTVVVADRHGNPSSSAPMYDDLSAGEEVAALRAIWAECSERNGYRVQHSWALPKMAWMLRHVRESQGARVFFVADFVGTWLIGERVATDYSHALKAGYDLVVERWPFDEFERAGIPAAALPPVVSPGSVIGVVGRAGSEATGLPIGTPLVAGMTDGCASQIASGAVRPGQWNFALGTTFVLKGVSGDLLRDPSGALYSDRHPDGGWLPGGASSSGAAVLEATFPGVDPVLLDRAAAPHLPSPVLRYPLVARGERFPFLNPAAQPFLSGRPGSRAELAAALLQGVAFVKRLSLSSVAGLGADISGKLTITGATTRSDAWNQTRADVLGRPLTLPRSPESAVGMAILAAAGRGGVADAAERMVGGAATIDPRPEQSHRYVETYVRMVDELERRGYIDAALATRARAA